MSTSVVKLQAELDKLYDWLDNPEQNTVGRNPSRPKPNNPLPKTSNTLMFEEGRKFRV